MAFIWCSALSVGWSQRFDQPVHRIRSVVVVGSNFPVDTVADPAAVISDDQWTAAGWPGISELARGLVSVSGVDGQSNQFTSNGAAGAANVNLRGLGPSRTLVLLNGRRLAQSPFAIDDQAQMFVDLNHLPLAAMDRLEILGEGAGAIYGSDAVAGVVQMVTGEAIDGVRLTGRYRHIAPGRSESHVSVAMGWSGEQVTLFGLLGYDGRDRILLTDRQWAVRPYGDNPRGGWSSIGNPGAFVVRRADGGIGEFRAPDAGCADLGGVPSSSACRFQYTRFVNLVEAEQRWQAFGEAKAEFGRADLRAEILWATTDVPHWQTSPSTPPQLWTEHVVPPDHPALERWRVDNPELALMVYGDSDPSVTELVFFGRPLGVSGNPLTGSGAAEGYRRRTTWRAGADVRVDLDDGQSLALGAFVSRAWGVRASADTYRAGFVNALRGYGVCSDPITGDIPADARPGLGGCEYFNPFSSAVSVSRINGVANEGYVPALANSLRLIDWLRDPVIVEAVNDLLTVDAVYTGLRSRHAWALGVQLRQESRRVTPGVINDLSQTPGPDRTGVFSFLAATEPVASSRSVIAAFAETRYHVTPQLRVTGAMRYEDYGVVSAFDPKLAVVWKRMGLSVRASAQALVRGPGLNQIGGVLTSLQYVAPTGSFRAVDRHGSADLKPETGAQGALEFTYVRNRNSLTARVWGIALRDAITVYDQSDIVSLAVAALERGDAGADILSRITFQDGLEPSPATIARVRTEIANGPELTVSGIDLSGTLVLESAGGVWKLSGSASYMGQFSVGSYAIDGNRVGATDVIGQFNITNAFRPLPRLKVQVGLDYTTGVYAARLSVGYTGGYHDERSESSVAAMAIWDASYRYRLSERMRVGIAISNIFDTPPPEVGFDLNYDPYTHSPFGRTISLSVSADLDG